MSQHLPRLGQITITLYDETTIDQDYTLKHLTETKQPRLRTYINTQAAATHNWTNSIVH